MTGILKKDDSQILPQIWQSNTITYGLNILSPSLDMTKGECWAFPWFLKNFGIGTPCQSTSGFFWGPVSLPWSIFQILTCLIWALWVHVTYLFTQWVTKSCDPPDWLIQVCYQFASLCVTETTFLTQRESYHCFIKYCKPILIIVIVYSYQSYLMSL